MHPDSKYLHQDIIRLTIYMAKALQPNLIHLRLLAGKKYCSSHCYIISPSLESCVEEVIESMPQCMTTFPAQDMFEIKE
jgi:hypothetical protein